MNPKVVVGLVVLCQYCELSVECLVLGPIASVAVDARVSKRNLPIRISRCTSNYYRLEPFSMSSDSTDDVPSILIPHVNMTAEDVVTTCMEALKQNNDPMENTGLRVCFDFSSDRCRAALGGNLEDFISYANNPTFGSMINAKEYVVLSFGPVIAATNTRGAMQTVLVKVKPANGNDRTFLW